MLLGWTFACGWVPTASVAGVEVDELSFDGVTAVASVVIDNPLPTGIGVEALDWHLAVAGRPLLSGTVHDPQTVPAGGTGLVRVPVTLTFATLYAVATAPESGEIPYELAADLTVSTPLGVRILPAMYRGTLPALAVPDFELRDVRLLTFEPMAGSASVAIEVAMTTPSGPPLLLTALEYRLLVDEIPVTSGSATFASHEATTVATITAGFALAPLGSTLVTAWRDGAPVDLRLVATATLGTPFGTLPLGFDRTARIETFVAAP